MARNGDGISAEELVDRHKALLIQIIDKATSDPQWKQKLLSDPQAAFDEAGFLPEIDALNPAGAQRAEVTGQMQVQTYGCVTASCPYTVVYKCAAYR